MMAPDDQPPEHIADSREIPRPEPVYCIIGDTVRGVRIWTEEEWERLEPAERPSPAEYAPGLGWVAPVVSHKPG